MPSTSRGITLIEGQNRAALVSDQNLMAQEVNTAIGKAVEETLATPAPSGLDANNIDQEITYVLSGQPVGNLPPDAPGGGVLQTFVLFAASHRPKVQVYITSGSSGGIWTRFSGSAGWGLWRRMDGTNSLSTGGFLGTTGNLDDALKPGAYGYWSSTTNRPGSESGVVWVSEVHNSDTLVQLAVGYNGGLYSRFSGSVGWSAWKRLDGGGSSGGSASSPPASQVGYRTVPLALTVGGGGGTVAGVAGSRRMPVRFGARARRWRLHLRNINPRTGVDGPAVQVSSVYIGPASSGTYASAPTLIAENLEVGNTGAATPWQTTPLEADTEYALSYAFTPSGVVQQVVGGGWSASSPNSTSASLTRVTTLPLDAWIEAEVAPDVPVLAAFGDSLSSGVGATLPVYDSWLSAMCRELKMVPVHYTASGSTMGWWSDPGLYVWQRWSGLSRPDAVVHNLGSNDVFGGASLTQLQSRFDTTVKLLEERVSPVVVAATILPRTSATGDPESIRRSYNTWLKSRSRVRETADAVPAVSNDDETLIASFDADGSHLTTSGYRAMANPIKVLSLTKRTTTGWRVLDTSDLSGSIRDPASPGTFRVRRDGDRVTLRFWGLRLTAGTGTGFILRNGLPVGYHAGGIRVAGQARDLFSTAWTHELTASTDDVSWVCYATHDSRSNVRPTGSGGIEGELTWITDDPMPL